VTWLVPRNLSADLAAAFTAATALFALPLYIGLYASPGPRELATLVFVAQVLPTFMILAVGQVLGTLGRSSFVCRAYWIAVALAAAASLMRIWQRQAGVGFPDAPSWVKLAAIASIVPAVMLLTLIRADWLSRVLARVAPPTALICAGFLVFVQVSSPTITSPSRSASIERGDTVFIFVFDELGRQVLERDGRVDRTRFPNLAALADGGVWLADATANYSPSCQSIPSLLSGRSQPRCDEYFLSGGRPTLLSVLATAYSLHVYDDYLRGCPNGAEACKGIPYFIATYPLEGITSHLFPQSVRVGPLLDLIGSRDANPYTLALWSDFLEQVRTTDLRGRAYYVHINLPHSPYAYRADGTLNREPSSSKYFYGSEQDVAAYENYRAQTQFTDALFGTFVDALRDRNAYEAATVVVTGDHGPRLQEAPRATALGGISAQTPGVPVILKASRPGHTSPIHEYQHIDFAPTLLDALDMSVLEGVEGRSVFDPLAQARPKWFITGAATFFRDAAGTWRRMEERVTWPVGLTPR
jgi:hypothetical protein